MNIESNFVLVPFKRSKVAGGALRNGPILRDYHLSGISIKRRKVYEDVQEFFTGAGIVKSSPI